MNSMKNGILDSLRKMGQSHPSIAVVYLFGSQATGKRGPLSDVDCAVLLKNGVLKLRDLFSFRLELIGEMMHACRRSDVDLIL